MQVLKNGTYEVLTALGLLGLVAWWVSLHNDPRIINPTLLTTGLVTLYLVVAIASEALIVSGLRPTLRQVLVFNVLVAIVITQPAWNRANRLTVLLGLAVFTVILRMAVSIVSLRAPKVSVLRFTSMLIGGPLLVGALWTGVNLAQEAYYSYYLFPKFKEGYITPMRWQDIVSLVLLWGGTAILLYLSYRLLKYAFRHHEPSVAA